MAEKQRQEQAREKQQDRYDFRRQWRADIEQERWSRMANEFSQNESILKSKQARARIGKNR